MEQIDNRSRELLKTLIEQYIAEGQPVGSRSLSHHSGLKLSPATIRNVMSDLEHLGFIASPHTSAGRIPTPKGYRFFIDSLLTVQPLRPNEIQTMQGHLHSSQPQRLISSASKLLSRLTHFAGVVAVSHSIPVRIRQIEFVHLSDTRILLIIVTSTGEVQNRLLHTRRPYSTAELIRAANYLTTHFADSSFTEMHATLKTELAQLRSDMLELMNAALTASGEALHDVGGHYAISGKTNLLEVEDLSSNMARLRELFKLFEKKTELVQLLDLSNRAEGVQIFIGGESGLTELDGCSVITASYQDKGQIIGTVGVIGPTRMAYNQVIPIVDITARLLTNALSHGQI